MSAKKILIVEDEPGVEEFLAGLLREKGGYAVVEAGTPEAAISLSRQEPFADLLLIDVKLGGMDGKQLASIIRQERRALPILFMSGYPIEYLVARGTLEVTDPFLHKPFSPHDLLTWIRRLLQQDDLMAPDRDRSSVMAGRTASFLSQHH